MANRIENAILDLAQRFQLEKGRSNDYYELHQAWCLTKWGAAKITKACGITFDPPEATVTPVSIAYQSTFRITEGDAPERSVHVVGSARFDAKAAEGSHTAEMAWKRMVVRGVIELVAAGSGVYGEEEFGDDFRKKGNDVSKTSGPSNPQPPVVNTPPVQSVTATATAAPPNQAPANYPPPGTPGWFNNAEKLPSDWNNAMADLCETIHQDRASWEKLMFDHGGKYKTDRGWWKPSQKYSSFEQMVFFVDDKGKSKASFALKILSSVRTAIKEIKENGYTVLEVPSANDVLEEWRLDRFDPGSETTNDPTVKDTVRALPGVPQFPDDVPF